MWIPFKLQVRWTCAYAINNQEAREHTMMILLFACLQPSVKEENPKSSMQLLCEQSCQRQQEACPNWDSTSCVEGCQSSTQFMRSECVDLAESVGECYNIQEWSCEEVPVLQDSSACEAEQTSLDACMTIRDSGE